MLSKYNIWKFLRYNSSMSYNVISPSYLRGTVDWPKDPANGENDPIHCEASCGNSSLLKRTRQRKKHPCSYGIHVHQKDNSKGNAHHVFRYSPAVDTKINTVTNWTRKIYKSHSVVKHGAIVRYPSEIEKKLDYQFVPDIVLPLSDRRVYVYTSVLCIRKYHVSRHMSCNNKAVFEQHSEADSKEVFDLKKKESSPQPQVFDDSIDTSDQDTCLKIEVNTDLDGQCKQALFTESVDNTDQTLRHKETCSYILAERYEKPGLLKDLSAVDDVSGIKGNTKAGQNIVDKDETQTSSEVEVIETGKVVGPENAFVQHLSALEQTLRENEMIIPEEEEMNRFFPALPLIKHNSDLATKMSELTEYQPGEKRKVIFPTKVHNLAPLVNQSKVLTELVKLGVDLSKIESTEMADKIMKMDFKKDIKPYLLFLHDVGVPHDEIGRILTQTPYLLEEDIQTLKVRIDYFMSKKFSEEDIASMIVRNSRILLLTIDRVDAKLGFYQRYFKLTGKEVRQLVVHSPKHILVHEDWIKASKFKLSKFFGFTELELKKMFLSFPKLYIIYPFKLIGIVFDILHNKMDIPHSAMVAWPRIFNCDPISLEQRHRFLLKVDRAQYNPTKENYVSLQSLVTTSDEDFCVDVAKASLTEYYEFLKTI